MCFHDLNFSAAHWQQGIWRSYTCSICEYHLLLKNICSGVYLTFTVAVPNSISFATEEHLSYTIIYPVEMTETRKHSTFSYLSLRLDTTCWMTYPTSFGFVFKEPLQSLSLPPVRLNLEKTWWCTFVSNLASNSEVCHDLNKQYKVKLQTKHFCTMSQTIITNFFLINKENDITISKTDSDLY